MPHVCDTGVVLYWELVVLMGLRACVVREIHLFWRVPEIPGFGQCVIFGAFFLRRWEILSAAVYFAMHLRFVRIVTVNRSHYGL